MIPTPEFQTATLTAGDLLLLCCDGIVEAMTNEDAAECVYNEVES